VIVVTRWITIMIALAIFVAGCNGDAGSKDASPAGDGPTAFDGSTGNDAGGPSLSCSQNEPFGATGLDRSCARASDCVVARHMVDCCGTMIAFGLNAADEQRFKLAERRCAATFPACGCAPGPTRTDDGSEAFDDAGIEVACLQGTCTTYLEGCGEPCPDGRCCFRCTTDQQQDYYACSTACESDADCIDPALPACAPSLYGTTFCAEDVGCTQ
jgi:hypothetical protein